MLTSTLRSDKLLQIAGSCEESMNMLPGKHWLQPPLPKEALAEHLRNWNYLRVKSGEFWKM